jgi:hypothetical protein
MSFNYDEKGYAVAIKNSGKSRGNPVLFFDPDDHKEYEPTEDYLSTKYGHKDTRTKWMMKYLKEKTVGQPEESIKVNSNESFEVIPASLTNDEVDRDCFFLSGASGSGKSYFSAQLLNKYRAMGIKKTFVLTDIPDKKFGDAKYLNINDWVEDASIEFEAKKKEWEKLKIKFKHLKKSMEPEEIMELELLIQEKKPKKKLGGSKRLRLKKTDAELEKYFADSVVMFDDYEKNENIKEIEYFRDHLLTKSRHYGDRGCSLIICNHLTNGGHSMKLIKAEATDYVLFNKSSHNERRLLFQKYLGYDIKDVKRVSKMLKNSRWICCNSLNRTIISQKEAIRIE